MYLPPCNGFFQPATLQDRIRRMFPRNPRSIEQPRLPIQSFTRNLSSFSLFSLSPCGPLPTAVYDFLYPSDDVNLFFPIRFSLAPFPTSRLVSQPRTIAGPRPEATSAPLTNPFLIRLTWFSPFFCGSRLPDDTNTKFPSAPFFRLAATASRRPQMLVVITFFGCLFHLEVSFSVRSILSPRTN